MKEKQTRFRSPFILPPSSLLFLPPLFSSNNFYWKHEMSKVNIEQKLSLFNEQWKPKIVGELNGQYVKLVKFQGPFVFHHHDTEDEMFLVVKGRFRMEYEDHSEWIEE